MVASFFASSCKNKNTQNQIIPFVLVDIQINVNNPGYLDLTIPGGSQYVAGGSQGLIVYRTPTSEFIVYDRHTPHEVENNCKVSIDQSGLFLEDQCTESQFDINNGFPTKGPANQPMHRYQAQFSPPYLHIFN